MIRTPAMSYGRVAAIVLGISLVARTASAEVVNRIVATVDGDPITAYELRRYGEERKAVGVAEQDVLQALITDKLLEKEISERKIAAKPDEIDHYLEEVRSRAHLNEEQFQAALKQQNMTLDQYKARVKEEIEKTHLVNQEIRSRVNVSREEVERYYNAHRAEFASKSGVTVRDVFFALQPGMSESDAAAVVERARAVKKLADDGTPFDDLARQYSQGPGADKGGLLGTFKKGEMAPSLEKVVFALKPGEVSEPVVTSGGVHLLKVDDVTGDGTTVSLDSVKDQIRDSLYNDLLEQRFRDWISKDLREKHHVEVLN